MDFHTAQPEEILFARLMEQIDHDAFGAVETPR